MGTMEEKKSTRNKLKTLWNGLAGFFGLLAGLAPHVLHHLGLIAGVAFISGTTGTILFGLLGLAATVPLLIKLYHRFNTVLAPLIALSVFVVMFLLSSLIIGPWVRGDRSSPTPTEPTYSHASHHQQ